MKMSHPDSQVTSIAEAVMDCTDIRLGNVLWQLNMRQTGKSSNFDAGDATVV